jgi:hypothetical protein
METDSDSREIEAFARGFTHQGLIPPIAEICSVDFKILRLIENHQDRGGFHLGLSFLDS